MCIPLCFWVLQYVSCDIPSRSSEGSTDVLMRVNQVSWRTMSMFRLMFRFRWSVR